MVPTGCRISWPHGTEKPVNRSRHDAGKGSSTRILGAVVVECARSHTAHSSRLPEPSREERTAHRVPSVRPDSELSTHGAEPCCSPWLTAAAKPRFESFTITVEFSCRTVPTLSSDERLSTTTTRTEMLSWLASESMQVGRSAALL